MYRTATPRPWDKAFNLTILRYLWRFRDSILGVYYIPKLGSVVPVLRVDTELPPRFFVKIDESVLRNSYRMVCLRGCGACCEVNAGVFMFEEELEEVSKFAKRSVVPSMCETVTLLNGEVVKVCSLPRGRCPFYDPLSRSCTINEVKPIICRVHYCTLVAERNGVLYYKKRGRRGKPVYVPWRGSVSELTEIVRKSVLALAKIA